MCVIVTAVPGAMPEPEDILAMSETNPCRGAGENAIGGMS